MQISSFRPQAQPMAPQFSGLHPNAAVGVGVKVSGIQSAQENTSRLWFKLKNAGLVERDYTTNYPLLLIRERHNEHDANAIGLYTESDAESVRRKIGYVPKELAKSLAPLIDQGHEFAATLTQIRPYRDRKSGKWFHSMETRLEYVSKPGRAPNQKVLKKVQNAFEEARSSQEYQRVLTLMPEEMRTHAVGSDKVIEKVDHEQHTVSYYRKGHLLAGFSLHPVKGPKPTYERPLPEKVESGIKRLLDKHG